VLRKVAPLFPGFQNTNDLFSEFEEAAIELKEWGIALIKVDGAREKELTDQVLLNKLSQVR
jgi:hypothetical protein